MNSWHSILTDWGLRQIEIPTNGTILDIGCGGGGTISKLAALAPAAKIIGIDYSDDSLAIARKTNARLISAGRVDIREGSVSQLPFADNTFDVVTAIETHFFWPDLPNDFRQTFRISKLGGALLVVAEIYRGGKHLEGARKKIFDKHLAANMNLLTPGEHRELFTSAGFSDVQIFEELDKGWICCVGRKSS